MKHVNKVYEYATRRLSEHSSKLKNSFVVFSPSAIYKNEGIICKDRGSHDTNIPVIPEFQNYLSESVPLLGTNRSISKYRSHCIGVTVIALSCSYNSKRIL